MQNENNSPQKQDNCGSPYLAEVAGGSEIGNKREVNQDHFLIAGLQRTLTILDSNVPHDDCQHLTGSDLGLLMVVADGMGGHVNGEIASTTAIESSARYVLDMMHWFLKLSNDDEDDFIDELSNCLISIQRKIWEKNDIRCSDSMGTTVTMAYVIGDRMYVVHAGDSRCYLLRDGELKQITTDHTLAQQLFEKGALSADEAESSRWRHVLWNCVGGSGKKVQPEVTKVKLREHDMVLLCSDGLTGMVSDDEIANAIQAANCIEVATKQLIQMANDAGGTDNITVVIARDFSNTMSEELEDADTSDIDTVVESE